MAAPATMIAAMSLRMKTSFGLPRHQSIAPNIGQFP
jgi:hypothetical protein